MQDPPRDQLFVEIRHEGKEDRPRTLEAFVVEVEPRDCSQFVKKLAKELPLPSELQHLKRVRKQKSNPPRPTAKVEENSNDGDSQPAKKPKLMLQVLIGRKEETMASSVSGMGPFYQVIVPGRPPESKEENQEFNTMWPTHFFPLKSEEHREQELAISDPKELEFMRQTIENVMADKSVVIVDPNNQTIVSFSEREARAQDDDVPNNPLATPILLALQGVSRLERDAARNLSANDFSKGQYLCTGYDLYTYYEPSVFEAMSCVHSRLRRLIFNVPNDNDTTTGPQKLGSTCWANGCSRHRIHCLPGTNHKFRAFQYVQKKTD